MMHRAWSSIVEVPYCFSRSYIKFQGHTALKIVEFDPNWAFPDCNSSLNSPMAMKCCTKLETAKERCPIVFQGHPSNFKVTRYKTSPILTQIGRFRTIGRSQLSNPLDLPCLKETANITQRHSWALFWLYWNTQLLIDPPVVDTPYLLQYRYYNNAFFHNMFKCMDNRYSYFSFCAKSASISLVDFSVDIIAFGKSLKSMLRLFEPILSFFSTFNKYDIAILVTFSHGNRSLFSYLPWKYR